MGVFLSDTSCTANLLEVQFQFTVPTENILEFSEKHFAKSKQS